MRSTVAIAAVLGVLVLGCGDDDAGTSRDGGPEDGALTDSAVDGPECTPGCHWDCFGGSQCADGVAWINGGGPRECCTTSDPWPGPGPVCSNIAYPCASGECGAPDPRYAGCLGRSETDPAHLILYCAEGGTAKTVGTPCTSNAGCRPAADGVSRLVCDTAGTGLCVEEPRPAPAADYGATCGLAAEDVPGLDGERIVTGASCALCQTLRAGECVRQGCTQTCTFDEDCPTGSICLCSTEVFGPAGGYCAPATDRTTPEGRAAGLGTCP